MKFLKPSDLAVSYLKVLIYGKSGIGKTYLATTAPNALVIDPEGGSISASRDDIAVMPTRDITEVFTLIKELKEGKYPEFKTIIFDSLTEIGELIHLYLKKKYPERRESMVMWQDYDLLLRQLIQSLKDIKRNIIVTALEEDIVTEKFVGKYPLIKGSKFKSQLPAYFDLVIYLNKNDENKRVMYLEATGDFIAKNRLKRFNVPDVIEEDNELYNFENLINYVKQQANKSIQKR